MYWKAEPIRDGIAKSPAGERTQALNAFSGEPALGLIR
jgi:hypothetical protein